MILEGSVLFLFQDDRKVQEQLSIFHVSTSVNLQSEMKTFSLLDTYNVLVCLPLSFFLCLLLCLFQDFFVCWFTSVFPIGSFHVLPISWTCTCARGFSMTSLSGHCVVFPNSTVLFLTFQYHQGVCAEREYYCFPYYN